MNINNPTTFGSPNLSLSTSNSSGTGGALRSDDTILVYDTTVPTTIASGASAAVGDVATSARRNHTHGMFTVTAQAVQGALEAETNQDTYAPPDLIKYSPGVAKAYCRIADPTALVAGSYNTASITDTGAGNSTWVIATDFADVNWVPTNALTQQLNDDSATSCAPPAAGSVIVYRYTDASLTNRPVALAGHGEQV